MAFLPHRHQVSSSHIIDSAAEIFLCSYNCFCRMGELKIELKITFIT